MTQAKLLKLREILALFEQVACSEYSIPGYMFLVQRRSKFVYVQPALKVLFYTVR